MECIHFNFKKIRAKWKESMFVSISKRIRDEEVANCWERRFSGGFKLWAFIYKFIPLNWKIVSEQGGNILGYPKLKFTAWKIVVQIIVNEIRIAFFMT